jgi:hypothetical protein
MVCQILAANFCEAPKDCSFPGTGETWHRKELLVDPKTDAHSRRLSYAALRVFVAVFRPVCGFSCDPPAVFLALGAALVEDDNSGWGCFAVRWWTCFRSWVRAVSSSIRSSESLSFWRSSSRYAGMVFVVIIRVWQNCPYASCAILVTH